MGPSPKNMCEDPAIQRFIQSNIEEIFVTGKNFQLLRSQSAKSRTYKQRKSKVFFVFFFLYPKSKAARKVKNMSSQIRFLSFKFAVLKVW